MKLTIRGYITHKAAEKYVDCADSYAYSITNHRFAISDGVTKSFFPKIWSRILVDKFVALQGATDLSIEDCQSEWLQQVEKIALSADAMWFTKNAFIQRKSGLATLVTLRFDQKMWYAKALGDSFLFFVPKGKNKFTDWLYLSSKYTSSKQGPVEFDSYPDYYSSREGKNGIEKEMTKKLEAGRFYLMTDALAEWLINEKENALNEIETWHSQEVFEQKVTALRNKGLMNNDDSSILIIDIEKDIKRELSYKSVSVQNIDVLLENKDNHTVKKENMNNNEQILQKIEENSIAVHKKINRLMIVNGALFLIFGMIFVFLITNKNPKQMTFEKEVIENWVHNDSVYKKNVWDLFMKTVSELENSAEKIRRESTDIQQNDINANETDSIK